MSLPDLLRAAFAEQARNMHTAMPGEIVDYDSGQQRASVRPALDRNVNGAREALPVINNVPVIFPRSGGAFMTFPVSAGDSCLLIFTERSLDEWKGQGGTIAPDDPRAFDLSDACAIMGFSSFNAAGGSDDVVISYGGSTVTITKDTITLKATKVIVDGDFEVNGDSEMKGNVEVAGNLGVTGDMNSRGGLNITGPYVSHLGKQIGATHRHTGVQTGGGTTGSPT